MVSKTTKRVLGGIAVLGIGFVGVSYAIGSNPIMLGAAAMNELFSIGNPGPQIKVELREAATTGNFAPNRLATAQAVVDPGTDWPAYNRTVYGDRYSPLNQINAENVGGLEVVCEYDTKRLEGFQVTPIVVDGSMVLTTTEDTISINPATCAENWKAHESSGTGFMPVNRGAAYINGKIVRGYPDGYVRAYDLANGNKLWETYVGDKETKLWFTSAAAAWDGMIFYGTAGGDVHNVRGRVYGLDAETGEVKWQTFTVPHQADDQINGPLAKLPTEEMAKTWGNPPDVPVSGGGVWTTISVDPSTGQLYVPVGNPAPDFVKSLRVGSNLFSNTMLVLDAKTGDYVKHFSIMGSDWHDWDMSNAPIFYRTRGGKDVFSFHPKDGHVYSYDLADDLRIFRMPVTKMLNTDAEFVPHKEQYFCPGSVGGGEWNGAAFDPAHNLVFTGQNEWCTTAKIGDDDEVNRTPDGMVWFGVDYIDPYKLVGQLDPVEKWGGWVYATDADTGQWKWRARANYPTISGMTPTAGGILAFGDMGGNFRTLRSSDGKVLFEKHFKGAIAGGVITYLANGKQYIAFTSGTSHPQWPVEPTTGKIVIMGLPGA